MTRHREVRPVARTTDRFAQVLGVRRGPDPFPASTAVAVMPDGERYGVFAQTGAATHRVGGWYRSYGQALNAYALMVGANYRGHRLAHRGSMRRYENVTLCVRSKSDPAFVKAPRIEHTHIRVVCGGGRGGRYGTARGLRTREGAARAYARRLGLDGSGGWFRATDARGQRVGPVIAQGLDQLAEVADAHERDGGIFYSVPVPDSAPAGEFG